MDLTSSHAVADEKHFSSDDEKGLAPLAYGAGALHEVRPGEPRDLSRALKGRHMQMIAIGKIIHQNSPTVDPCSLDRSIVGGSIGAGLFVGSGGALYTGGPGSLVCSDFLHVQSSFAWIETAS